MKYLFYFCLLVGSAHAQVLGWGNVPAAKFAQVLTDCPTVTTGYFVCPVVPVSGQPYIAMSVAGFGGGTPFVVVSQGPQGLPGQNGQTGPQGPPGQSVPKNFTLTCVGGKGTVQSGFTLKCSWQ